MKRPLRLLLKISVNITKFTRTLTATMSFLLPVLSAQALSYRYFTSDHELSSSLINQIYQDSRGMVWIATEDGLNRYDGSKFTVYHYNPGDSTSLQHNFVKQVFEDSKGNLFVGTYQGLQTYDPAADSFSKPMPILYGTQKRFGYPISDIFERKNGDVVVVSNSLFIICRSTDGTFVLEPVKDCGLNNVSHAAEDFDGNLWLVSGNSENQQIYRLMPGGRQDEIQDVSGMNIQTLTIGNDGTIYLVALRSGLLRYDSRQDQFVQMLPDNNSEIPAKSIFDDQSNSQLLIATDGKGLKIYNRRNGSVKDFFNGNRDFSLPGEKIHSILRDNNDNFWIGIFQKGIIMFPEHQSNFGYIGPRSAIHNVIGDKCVTALCKDDDGVLWVGTDNDGIYALNPDLSLKRHYKEGLPTVTMGLCEIKGHICVGSFLDGWGLLDKDSGKFQPMFTTDGSNITSVYDFSADDKGKLWIATMGDGVIKFDPDSNSAVKMQAISDGINPWVSTIHYSRNTGKLYLGTYDGLYEVYHCDGQPEIRSVYPGTIVYSITEGIDGLIWCGTSTGLLSYNPENGESLSHTSADGFPSNTIYAIETEGRNALWLSTNAGLIRFDLASERVSAFHADDGLQGNEFYKNVSYKDNRGLMYFGGMNGITFFSPADVNNQGMKYTPRIVDFYIHGMPVKTGMKSGNRDIITAPVYETGRVNLSHADNSFSIEFSTIELFRPESVLFMYSLDNDSWETLPAGINRVNFSNINPGVHTLRVKTLDNDVESDVIELKIDIAHLWYQTAWAYLIALLLLAAIVWFIIMQVRQRQRHKKEEMEHEHNDRIKEARLQFFTNISHDIRTPMTLIISPIEKLLSKDPDPSRQKEYKLIHRNAKRILRLINELMDIRKIDKSQMKLIYTETQLVPLIEDICATFSQGASDKNISLTFSHEGNDYVTAWVDVANFDKIIMNLLSNALKFTPEGGTISIGLSTGTNKEETGLLHDYVEIMVTDSGIGIPEEDRDHIFDRFYQVDTSNLAGTGIGLHLAHSLVTMHQGTITVSDNPEGNGARFIIRLPLGNSHLNVSDIALAPDSDTLRGLDYDTGVVTSEDITACSEPAPAGHPISSERILVVEDDKEIRGYICAELASRYKVTECCNGKEALDIIFKKTPSLIISDVMMPEMDGLTLTRRIKKNINLHHIPVILLTAKSQDRDNIEGLESGADAYITKPFNIDILMSTVHNLLQSRKKLRNAFSGNQEHDEEVTAIKASSGDERLMERVMKVLDNNISNPDITVEMLADEVGMSRVHLHRKLKELTNQSPREFIRNTRLRQAARLMREKRLNVSEVANLTGFRNPNNFATSFKDLFGVSPTEYINASHHEAHSDE